MNAGAAFGLRPYGRLLALALALAWGNPVALASEGGPPAAADSTDGAGAFARERFTAGGYLKQLQVITHLPALETALVTAFWHHRLNTSWRPAPRWSLGWEQRTRFFVGDDVRTNPAFAAQLETDPGVVDASWVPWSGPAALLHTRVERLWVQYAAPSWEIRAGRQRINWGVHLVWNPNDLFNAFNFLDFDYAERPGADALRVLGYLPGGQVLEAAWAPGLDAADWRADGMPGHGHTAALRYGFRVGSYDAQLIAGWRNTDYVLAAGWAGNLGLAGLKGEAAWFRTAVPAEGADADAYTATVSVDRSWNAPVYTMAGALYTSQGATGRLDALSLETFGTPSPRLLSPAAWTAIGQASWTPTPLLSLDASVLYGPGPDLLIVFPSVRYNIAANWDCSLTGQLFWLEDRQGLSRQADAAFVRVTWSY